MAPWCRRKKDHGRAEALLIAAWASAIPISDAAFEAAFQSFDPAAPTDGTNGDGGR